MDPFFLIVSHSTHYRLLTSIKINVLDISVYVPSPTPKKKKKELAGAKALYATSTERWEFVYLHQVEHSVFKALKYGLRLLSDDCVYTRPVVTLRIFESVAWFAFREGKGSACDKVL